MDQRQFEATLADAEIRLRRLRMLYDQWFAGIERVEPRTQRGEVDKIVAELRRAQPRNTALRFRFNQLVQRYTTYNTYWQRITRQIEEGTYKRDVLRAKRRFADPERAAEERPAPNESHDLDLDIDIEAALDAVRKSEPPIPVGTAPEGDKRSSSRPPPNAERPLRALREITPFALPDELAQAAAVQSRAVAPPMPSARPTRKGPPPLLSTPPADQASAARAAAPVPPAPLAAAGVATPAPAVSRKPPPLPTAASLRPMAATPPAARAAPPAPAPAPAQPAAAPSALSEDQIQTIYKRYVDARRNNSERTDNVKIETVAKTVREMMPRLTQKHAGKKIDFEVVVKDGKVALKPVAK